MSTSPDDGPEPAVAPTTVPSSAVHEQTNMASADSEVEGKGAAALPYLGLTVRVVDPGHAYTTLGTHDELWPRKDWQNHGARDAEPGWMGWNPKPGLSNSHETLTPATRVVSALPTGGTTCCRALWR